MFIPKLPHLISLTILFIYFFGILAREYRHIHAPLMLFAYFSDILLVLYIEVTRDAVETAITLPGGILGIHIIFAVLSVILSTSLVIFGTMLYFGKEYVRKIHLVLAFLFFPVRFLNYFTSLLIN